MGVDVMSEKNNKIKIGELLEAANVKNLGPYFCQPTETSMSELLISLHWGVLDRISGSKNKS